MQGNNADVAPAGCQQKPEKACWDDHWAAAVAGIEWMDSLVKVLQELKRPGSRAAAHMLLVVVLSYGVEGVGSASFGLRGGATSTESSSSKQDLLPGVVALLPPDQPMSEKFTRFRPRQSYRLRNDVELENIRYWHCWQGKKVKNFSDIF